MKKSYIVMLFFLAVSPNGLTVAMEEGAPSAPSVESPGQAAAETQPEPKPAAIKAAIIKPAGGDIMAELIQATARQKERLEREEEEREKKRREKQGKPIIVKQPSNIKPEAPPAKKQYTATHAPVTPQQSQFASRRKIIEPVEADPNAKFVNLAKAISNFQKNKITRQASTAAAPSSSSSSQNASPSNISAQNNESSQVTPSSPQSAPVIHTESPDIKVATASAETQELIEAVGAIAGEGDYYKNLYLSNLVITLQNKFRYRKVEQQLHDLNNKLKVKEALIQSLTNASDEIENYVKELQRILSANPKEYQEMLAQWTNTYCKNPAKARKELYTAHGTVDPKIALQLLLVSENLLLKGKQQAANTSWWLKVSSFVNIGLLGTLSWMCRSSFKYYFARSQQKFSALSRNQQNTALAVCGIVGIVAGVKFMHSRYQYYTHKRQQQTA